MNHQTRPSTFDGMDLNVAVELMYWALRVFTDEPDRVLLRRRLGRVHHRVLYCIARRPGARVSDVAAVLGVSRQALHGPLSQLKARRLVRVEVPNANARERLLFLTKSGVSLEEDLTGGQRARLHAVFAAAGPEATADWRTVMIELARPGIEGAPPSVRQLLEHLA